MVGASVYLSHTSKGTTTSSSGDFNLQNLPEGKYDLVISAIGYETKIIQVSGSNFPNDLKIKLSLRATELDEVVVQPADKNGWRIYGKYFTDNFIGTTLNAKYCRIINREVIRFRFSKKNNVLVAKADEPIIIENKMLGYKISFELIEFTADFNTDFVAFYGYPLFNELGDSKPGARRKAYYGSMMHFMRSVYKDRLREEGFTVRATVFKPNMEKQRVRKILGDSTNMHHNIAALSFGAVNATSSDVLIISEDSMRYYKKVIKQPDTLVKTESLATLNEMISIVGANNKFLFFRNLMEVQYKNRISEIVLKTPVAIEILENGSYFSPAELVTYKYWSKQEKICNMLPLDYYP